MSYFLVYFYILDLRNLLINLATLFMAIFILTFVYS